MTLWYGAEPLALASRSSARRAVLEGAGIPVELIDVAVDERAVEGAAPRAEAAPDDVARLLARTKAMAGSRKAGPGRLVMGADQTLALGGIAFHKPRDREGARLQLQRLVGRTHALHSAVSLVRDETVVFETMETAVLTMRPLSQDAIEAYLDAGCPAVLSSVGCYQMEGLGVHLFERIEGDHFTILGLPILPVLAFLRDEGLVP